MTTAAPSTALVTIQPAFTDPKRLAVAEFVVSARAPQMWGCDPYWAYGARRPRRHRAVAGKVVPGRAGRGTGPSADRARHYPGESQHEQPVLVA